MLLYYHHLQKSSSGVLWFCFFSGRNSNLQNRGFVSRRYKTLEGTTTYATKYVELCCPFSNKKLVESNQIFKFITCILTNTVQILYCFTCEAAKWYKNKAVSRTKKALCSFFFCLFLIKILIWTQGSATIVVYRKSWNLSAVKGTIHPKWHDYTSGGLGGVDHDNRLA